jgi:hypothetical protein
MTKGEKEKKASGTSFASGDAAKTQSRSSKKPYSKPVLTVHGDLRSITRPKGGVRRESGRPKTFSSGQG